MIEEARKMVPFAAPSTPIIVVRSVGKAAPLAASGNAPVHASTVALGTPPLQMILVHTQDDRPNAAPMAYLSVRTKEEITEDDEALRLIVRLIEHLNKES
jgi:hypothetical protein